MRTTCTTCCRPVNDPYRVYGRDGKVIQGCIEEGHTPHLIPGSESERWHNRPEARRMRSEWVKRLALLLAD